MSLEEPRDTSDKESSDSESDNDSRGDSGSDTELAEAEKAERLRERNMKRLRDKVTGGSASAIKQVSKTPQHHVKKDDMPADHYDGDISALESPHKVNKIAQNMANNASLRKKSAPGILNGSSSEDHSKLIQLYNRRKRQQESQIRSEFSANDIINGKGFIKDVKAGKIPS